MILTRSANFVMDIIYFYIIKLVTKWGVVICKHLTINLVTVVK